MTDYILDLLYKFQVHNYKVAQVDCINQLCVKGRQEDKNITKLLCVKMPMHKGGAERSKWSKQKKREGGGAKQKVVVRTGIWTRDLSHPKGESYH